ncbi:MAG: cell wall anchor protein, partial [Acutalibacter sp.]
MASPHLTFVVTAGNSLILSIPPYAQDSLIQADKDATVSWVTNVFDFYPDADVTFTVSLFAGTETTGTPIETYTVENPAASTEKITEYTIPAADLPVTYPQSQYTVQVSMASPEARSDDTGITVLSPPTEMRITADKTSITDGKTLELNYSINNASATGTLSATRMAGGETPDDTGNWLTATSVSGEGTVTFKPSPVSDGALYDTYTITFTEDTQAAGANFAPSTDSLVLYVYKRDALSIQSIGQDVESISLNNASKVDGAGKLPTESDDIMVLRQELGLIAYVSINAAAHNWSSFRDGIQWALSGDAENVAINYRQGGLWDNIEDLSYETYLPQTQMAISATADVQGVTVTATHAATGMSDTVTVDVETLQDKLYMFQATPAQVTTVTYTTGKGEARTLTTNADGLLVVYEPDSIASDVQFRSGDDSNPNLGTIAQEALSSGERDAAKLQLYPLNAITLVPAAKAELYLVRPDGTPFANQTVTLRGGVYLEDNYCGEDVRMGPDSNSLVPGNTDGTYTTDGEGKLTVHM